MKEANNSSASYQIAIFASGRGSNAEQIIDYFSDNPSVNICLILSNRSKAKVLELAEKNHIPTLITTRDEFYHSDKITKNLVKYNVDLVVLAGFLWLIPAYLVKAYPDKILNIHPALLPKFGGKGMYGMNIHKAVHNAKENETGITIHYVNEVYDDGEVIFQAACKLSGEDTPERIAEKVLALEHHHLPRVIEQIINTRQ